MTYWRRFRELFINTSQADAQQVMRTSYEDATSPRIGDVLVDNYRLVKEVGRGALGVVYLADDLALEQRVAVKVLLPEHIDPGTVALFRREARLLASVHHENVVRAYFAGEHRGTAFFVMEYLDGKTLAELLKGRLTQSFDYLLTIALQICNAVRATHDAGVFHRDVKPANIIIISFVRAVLVDFGLAKAFDVRGGVQIIGTPDYLAPEAARQRVRTIQEMKRCDVYSLGMTIYELFVGKLPFPTGEVFEVLRMHRDLDPRPPSAIRPELSKVLGLDRAILRAIARDPKERFQTCDEFIDELLTIQTGE